MAKQSAKSPSTNTPKRPPVIVVMGHVDHGKTTLLDTIRHANVVSGEAGGITQHIGAYQARIRPNDPASTITFIDTPGHEAFSKMRSRGAKVADMAILVVAANDGVKPQTKEAIQHIKKTGIPFVVAINKIDLEGVNLDVVKSQLAENDVIVEDYGGQVVAVPISAKKNQGVTQLLEMLELLYELQETTQDDGTLRAVVLESFVDAKKGVVANLLVRTGTINIGQTVYCQGVSAKVKSLLDDKGMLINQAGASQPVQVLGFKSVLPVGGVVTSQPSGVVTEEEPAQPVTPVKKEETDENQPKLKIIIKADVAGTLEAIKATLTEEIDLVGEGIGDVSESDVLLAQSTGARLIGFHVRTPKAVKKLAEMEDVKIDSYDVIYHLLEDLQKRVLKLMEPTINEEVLGTAEIIAEFKIHGNHIAGCKVIEGMIIRSERVRVMREERMIAEPRIGAMQVERQDTKEAKKGQEVALVFRPDVHFRIGDTVVSYRVVEE